MKGIPTQCVDWTAHNCKDWFDPERINAVRELYLRLLNDEEIEFDLTQKNTQTMFENSRNFTVRTRDTFERHLKFINSDVLKW